MKDIAILFLSIFFESLPFLLLGAFLSSLIEEFVSDEVISKIIPKNIILGSLFGIFLGFFLPACDCAVIPISRKMIQKKVPLNVAISFMLSSPIINPVVLLATYTAFYQTNIKIFYYRFIFGIIISLIIGIIMGVIFHHQSILKNDLSIEHQSEEEEDDFKELEKYTIHFHSNHVSSIIKHTGEELLDVMKFLFIGSLLASAIQVIVPNDIILMFHSNKVLSIIILMLFAYFISLCSTSDSFVGRSLLTTFGENAVFAYLLLGPMIDIKNTIVLAGNYQKKFVLFLISLIFIIIFFFSLVVRIL